MQSDFEEVMGKRLRSMAVRILACIEHTLSADLVGMDPNESHTLSGSDLNIIRGEVLNAAGDTTRALSSLVSSPKTGRQAKVSLSRDIIAALNKAHVDIINEDEPIIRVSGDFNLLSKIRGEIGAGVVYNKTYTCVGIDDIVNSVIPFLDPVQFAGIKLAHGDYRDWRDAVCELYLGGLGNE